MARGEQQFRTPKSVRVVKLPHARDLALPAYQSAGAAGLDLVAAVPANKPLRLKRGARALVPTGLILEIPIGFEAQIRPRSGLALMHGITVLNSPGSIDSDYRGEVQVILINLGEKLFVVQRGERIAQMVIASVARLSLRESTTARPTVRGTGGFGSTGVAMAPTKAVKGQASKPVKTKKAGKASKSGKSGKNAVTETKVGTKRSAAAVFPRRILQGTARGSQGGDGRVRRR